MNDREHAEEILEAARRDLRALRAMDDIVAFPDEIFGFHAQQSVEKAMKRGSRFSARPSQRRTTSKKLIDLLRDNGISTDAMDTFVDLNAFAVQYRYESLYVDEEDIDRPDLVERVGSLIDQVAVAIRG